MEDEYKVILVYELRLKASSLDGAINVARSRVNRQVDPPDPKDIVVSRMRKVKS